MAVVAAIGRAAALRVRRTVAAATIAAAAGSSVAVEHAGAQGRSLAACDSTIAAAKVGDTSAGLFISIGWLTAGGDDDRSHQMAIDVGNAFAPPRPFQLSVFSGPALVPSLRAIGADTAPTIRSPTVTGIYRVKAAAGDSAPEVRVVRRSLMAGFDSAAVAAIAEAANMPGVFAPTAAGPLVVDVAFRSDSVPGAQRLFAASFPRLPVRDAAPRGDNPRPAYPDGAAGDTVPAGVVLRFVVARDGAVEPGTIEVVRSAALPFVDAAYRSLGRQRFAPATVHGCAVAQQVDYPFAFFPPDSGAQGLTHRR